MSQSALKKEQKAAAVPQGLPALNSTKQPLSLIMEMGSIESEKAQVFNLWLTGWETHELELFFKRSVLR